MLTLVPIFAFAEFLGKKSNLVVVEHCMEIGYNELRQKEVVNLQNGIRMGKIIDMIVDVNGKDILGVVVPGVRRLFRANEDIFVPWCNISKIGDDVILVSLNVNSLTNVKRAKPKDRDFCGDCKDDFIS